MIIFVAGSPWSLNILENLADFGQCDIDKRAILLRRDQSPEQMTATLIHELIHAIWEIVDLDNFDPANLEETVAHRLGEAFGSIFCDPRNAATLATFGIQTVNR